jgi:hypothetical protein
MAMHRVQRELDVQLGEALLAHLREGARDAEARLALPA